MTKQQYTLALQLGATDQESLKILIGFIKATETAPIAYKLCKLNRKEA